MFIVSSSIVFNRAYLNDLLNELNQAVPAPATLNAAVLKLYQNPALALSPDTEYASFTVADFTGYADEVLATLTGPVSLDSNNQGLHGEGNFAVTGPVTTTNTIYGWYLANPGETDWICAGAFDEEVGMAVVGEFISLDIPIIIGDFASFTQ